MKKVKKCLPWFLVGVLLSYIKLAFSPWFLHFLPTIALVDALLLGGICFLLGLFYESVAKNRKVYVLYLSYMLLSAYFSIWFMSRSIILELNQNDAFFIILGLIFGLLVTSTGILWWFKKGERIHWKLSLVLLVGLLIIKFGIVTYLPPKALLPVKPSKSVIEANMSSDSLTIGDFVYPFSDFILTSMNRFEMFFGSDVDNPIFFLLLDGFRYDYHGKEIEGRSVTPRLDRLKSRGISAEQYRTQSNWTKPSTASLFTGLYAEEHGTIFGGGDTGYYRGHVLPGDFKTLAERLEDQGYKNFGAAMSSHISGRYNYDQGFHVWLSPGEGYMGDFYTLEQSLFWLLRKDSSKSFIYLHIKGPHQPFSLGYFNKSYWEGTPYYENKQVVVPGRFKFDTTDIVSPIKEGSIELRSDEVKFLRYLYGAQLNFYDRYYVSPFLKSLKSLGIYKSSLVVVTGDHGEELYDHGSYAHGQTLYEESIHTPLLMKFPESTQMQDFSTEALVESIDLSATLADFAGATSDGMQGNSFLANISGRNSDWSKFNDAYSQHTSGEYLPRATVVNLPWKFIYDFRSAQGELYNLYEDPGEESPVKGRPEIKERLKNKIFNRLGSDSVPSVKSIDLKEATEAEKENLKGLGYME